MTIRRLLLFLAVSFSTNFSVTFACMAMQPTHPSTMRPPVSTTPAGGVETTTSASSTTSSTSATTTTTVACDMCQAVVYQTPDLATCGGGGQFYCTDDELLTMDTNAVCRTFTCVGGARLFAFDRSGTPQPVAARLACARKTPAQYEDAAMPPKAFPDAARVFCQADTACAACANVPYSTNDPQALPATTLVDTSTLGKHGCPVKDCGEFQLQSADRSSILHSITCNPVLPGYVDKDGDDVTVPVACYDCTCDYQESHATLCPSGHFCQDFDAPVSHCKSRCAPGDLVVAYKSGSPPEGVSAPAADVFCDGANGWQPFGVADGILLQATCATPAALLLPEQPADTRTACPPLTDLGGGGGGTFSDVRYRTGYVDSNGITVIYATCRSGMITGAADGVPEEVASFLYCEVDAGSRGWRSRTGFDEITRATCRANSCDAFLMENNYTLDEIMQLDIVDESPGHCRARCSNGAPFKFTAAGQPREVASFAFYHRFFEYVDDAGEHFSIESGQFEC